MNDRLVRMGCRRAALASAAERLSKGAVALRAVARRDATYYSQVTALQRFWRIRVNPPTSAFAGAPFSAEVVFAEPTATTAATGAAAGGAGGSAGQATKGGAGRAGAGGGTGDGGDAGSSGLSPAQQLIMTVPLYKDPVTGEVRAQVEREEGPEAVALRASLLLAPSPTITNVSSVGEGEGGQQGTTGLPGQEDSEAAAGQGGGGQSLGKPSAGAAGSKAKADPGMDVAVGARDVHALLLGLQQRLLWMVVARGLEQDAAQGRGQAPITPFTHSLARKVRWWRLRLAQGCAPQPRRQAGVCQDAGSKAKAPIYLNLCHVSCVCLLCPLLAQCACPCVRVSVQVMSHLSKGPSLSLPTQTQAQHPQLEPGSTIGMDVDEGSVSRLASSLPAASYTAAWRASADVLALRPLALEHAVMCRVPAATIHLHPRPYTTPLHALPLLPDLSAAISHAHFRACLRQHLAVQAHEVRSVALHWAPTTRAATSAIRVCVRPNSQFLVIMQVGLRLRFRVQGSGLGVQGLETRDGMGPGLVVPACGVS